MMCLVDAKPCSTQLKYEVKDTLGDSIVVCLRHSTCDSVVAGSNPEPLAIGNNLRQIVHTHLPGRSQWSSGGVPGCSVRLPSVGVPRQLFWYTVLGMDCCILPAVPRSTQPSTLHGTIKWVSLAFGMSNNNKWRRWMWMVAASYYRRTHRPSQLMAWSEGWRPPGIQSAFIKWTEWTLAMALSHDNSTINII